MFKGLKSVVRIYIARFNTAVVSFFPYVIFYVFRVMLIINSSYPAAFTD